MVLEQSLITGEKIIRKISGKNYVNGEGSIIFCGSS